MRVPKDEGYGLGGAYHEDDGLLAPLPLNLGPEILNPES